MVSLTEAPYLDTSARVALKKHLLTVSHWGNLLKTEAEYLGWLCDFLTSCKTPLAIREVQTRIDEAQANLIGLSSIHPTPQKDLPHETF